MVDVADGGAVGYGIVVALGDAVYHLLHALVVAVGGVVGEPPHDEAAERGEHAAETEGVEDALHLIYRLGYVFDKEDGAGPEGGVGGGEEAGGHGEVAPEEGAGGGAAAVEGVAPEADGRVVAAQQVEEAAGVGVGSAVGGDVLAHGGVDGGDAVGVHQGVEGGDVGVAHDPLGVVAQGEAAQALYQVDGPIAAAGADDGAHVGVEQGGLEVGIAVGVGAGIGAVAVEGVLGGIDGPALFGYHGHGLIDHLRLDDAGGREDGDLVAGAERTGDECFQERSEFFSLPCGGGVG